MTPDPAVCRHNVPIYRYCAPCEEGWPDRPEPVHVTPVGGWLLIAGLVLAAIAAIIWRQS